MEFKDIKTWVISPDHKARPKDMRTKEDISLIIGEVELQLAKSRERIVKLKFEQFAQQHKYHCSPSLVAGEYPADTFGEPELQRYNEIDGSWSIAIKNKAGYTYRNYLPLNPEYLQLKQPVPNEVKEHTNHELKVWPAYFEQIWDGMKGFELRKNDRDYKSLDTLLLKEYLPSTGYTGREVEALITYVLTDVEPFGLKDGFCILSLKITNYKD
jgi:ParB family chromosome partitioning protein